MIDTCAPGSHGRELLLTLCNWSLPVAKRAQPLFGAGIASMPVGAWLVYIRANLRARPLGSIGHQPTENRADGHLCESSA